MGRSSAEQCSIKMKQLTRTVHVVRAVRCSCVDTHVRHKLFSTEYLPTSTPPQMKQALRSETNKYFFIECSPFPHEPYPQNPDGPQKTPRQRGQCSSQGKFDDRFSRAAAKMQRSSSRPFQNISTQGMTDGRTGLECQLQAIFELPSPMPLHGERTCHLQVSTKGNARLLQHLLEGA